MFQWGEHGGHQIRAPRGLRLHPGTRCFGSAPLPNILFFLPSAPLFVHTDFPSPPPSLVQPPSIFSSPLCYSHVFLVSHSRSVFVFPSNLISRIKRYPEHPLTKLSQEEEDIEDERKCSTVQMQVLQCVCIAWGWGAVDLCLDLARKASLLPRSLRRILKLEMRQNLGKYKHIGHESMLVFSSFCQKEQKKHLVFKMSSVGPNAAAGVLMRVE